MGGDVSDYQQAGERYQLSEQWEKDELVAKLAGNLVGKVAEFSGLLVATQRKFVGLVEARAKQLEESDAA